jgi:hypothetical protein
MFHIKLDKDSKDINAGEWLNYPTRISKPFNINPLSYSTKIKPVKLQMQ